MEHWRQAGERGVSRVALVLALCTMTLGIASAAWAIQVATTARGAPDRTLRVAQTSAQAIVETPPPAPSASSSPTHRPTSAPAASAAPRASSSPTRRPTHRPSSQTPARVTTTTAPIVGSTLGSSQDDQTSPSENQPSADD